MDQILRIGLADTYAAKVLEALPSRIYREIEVYCASSVDIARRFAAGEFDVGCMIHPPADDLGEWVTWSDPIKWVRGEEFETDPADTLPIIAFGDLESQIRDCLASSNTRHDIVFRGNLTTCLAAASEGFGLLAVPESLMPSNLLAVCEFTLPTIPPIDAGVTVRSACRSPHAGDLRALLGQISGLRHTVRVKQGFV